MNLIFCAVIISLFVESVTELLVKSSIFRPLRGLVFKLNNSWLTELITCGYCFSFWVALLVNLILNHITDLYYQGPLALLMGIFITHRLSNIIHGSIDRYFDTRYDIRYNKQDRS